MSIFICLITVVPNLFFSFTVYNLCLAWYNVSLVSPLIRRAFRQRLSCTLELPVFKVSLKLFPSVCASQILWECILNCCTAHPQTEYFILTAFHTLSTPAFSTPAFSASP